MVARIAWMLASFACASADRSAALTTRARISTTKPSTVSSRRRASFAQPEMTHGESGSSKCPLAAADRGRFTQRMWFFDPHSAVAGWLHERRRAFAAARWGSRRNRGGHRDILQTLGALLRRDHDFFELRGRSGGGIRQGDAGVDTRSSEGGGTTDSSSRTDSSALHDSGSLDTGVTADARSRDSSGETHDAGSREGGDAQAWSPASLGSALALWLQPSGITTTPCPTNASYSCVGSWADSSPNHHLAVPVNVATPPLMSPTKCNTAPVCTLFVPSGNFPGTGLEIVSTTPSSLDLSGGFTILAVSFSDAAANGITSIGGIYSRQAISSGAPGAALWLPYVSGTTYPASAGLLGGEVAIPDFVATAAPGTTDFGLLGLYGVVYDGATTLSLVVNGDVAATKTGLPMTTVAAAGRPAYIGGQPGQTFAGSIVELLVIDEPLSAESLSTVYAYYQALYGI